MALDMDDLEPRAIRPMQRELETLSVEELTNYIGELQGEIERARVVMARKQGHRSGAEAFFRKS